MSRANLSKGKDAMCKVHKEAIARHHRNHKNQCINQHIVLITYINLFSDIPYQ